MMDAELPSFPTVDTQEPVAFLDAAHANDLRNRQSTTGYAFLLCGGAISYQCKTQSITATSSTEAEFLAAVATAKHARYMRAIMTDLGFPPITAILRSPQFGFKSTTHDRSIYSATFEGTRILLLCQVDDFAVACPNEEIAKRLCDQIGKALQLPSEDTPLIQVPRAHQ